MKTKILIGLLILIVLLSGCGEKECKTDGDCLARTCFTVQCADNTCAYSPIADCCGNEICEVGETYPDCAADCPNCDDINECTTDSYDYHTHECVNSIIPNQICCGNTRCETGEDYLNCAQDCPNCDDDNDCTEDSYDYHEQECANEIIMECCGNGICEEGLETSADCTADCPDCSDGNKLTTDSFNYATQECENPVTHYFIDDFESGVENWGLSDPAVWSTTAVAGNTVLKAIGQGRADLREGGWDNYIFKFKFKIITGAMSANFRLNWLPDGFDRYYVPVENVLGKEEAMVGLNKQTVAGGELALHSARFSSEGGWHTLEIQGDDNIITIYVDDELLIKYTDTESPVLSGQVGFEIGVGREYMIDDVEIKLVTEDDVSYPEEEV